MLLCSKFSFAIYLNSAGLWVVYFCNCQTVSTVLLLLRLSSPILPSAVAFVKHVRISTQIYSLIRTYVRMPLLLNVLYGGIRAAGFRACMHSCAHVLLVRYSYSFLQCVGRTQPQLFQLCICNLTAGSIVQKRLAKYGF